MGPFFLFRLILVIVVIVLLTGSVLIIMKYYFRLTREPVPSKDDMSEDRRILMPLKLQAYERIILYLERIRPPGLIQRVSRAEMNSVQLQSVLVRTIRDEFEYNLSQQLYLSHRSWELVTNAKEETIKLIHSASGEVQDGASSQELIKAVLDQMVKDEKHPVDFAIDEIRKEFGKLIA